MDEGTLVEWLVAPGDAELAGIPDLNILRERLFPYAPVAPAAPGVCGGVTAG